VSSYWECRAQRNVTLSSSEAEMVALSEAAKEIKFIIQVLLSIGIEVKLPIIVHVDNVCAIFMAAPELSMWMFTTILSENSSKMFHQDYFC